MKKWPWGLLPLVIFVVLIIFLWRGLALDPQSLPSAQIGQTIPSFSLPSLNDKQQQFNSQQMHGHPALLNVWASWCEACAQEQVFLMHLARKGIVIYGLNYKDKRENARQWLAEWGNPYQLIGEDINGKVAIDLGVYGTPETFLLDTQGIIQYRHVGILDNTVWQAQFLPRIQKLKDKS